jgi:hypothetical protein
MPAAHTYSFECADGVITGIHEGTVRNLESILSDVIGDCGPGHGVIPLLAFPIATCLVVLSGDGRVRVGDPRLACLTDPEVETLAAFSDYICAPAWRDACINEIVARLSRPDVTAGTVALYYGGSGAVRPGEEEQNIVDTIQITSDD